MIKEALVTAIQRFCVHDGPGIRTTVFFQGCPLQCKWCQNPETIARTPQLMFNKSLCVNCKACIKVCPNQAIYIDKEGQVRTDRTKCKNSGHCEDACVYGARTMSSTLYSLEALKKILKRDRIFYKNSNGGITFSGGEPLVHSKFILELLKDLKEDGIASAIETAGFYPWEAIGRLVPYVDCFLFDLKVLTKTKHKYWVKQTNDVILSNLKELSIRHTNVIVRIPIIPGVNDDEEEFKLMLDWIKQNTNLSIVHLLPFHHLGSSKYELLHMKYDLQDIAENNQDKIDRCEEITKSYGFNVDVGGSNFDFKKEN